MLPVPLLAAVTLSLSDGTAVALRSVPETRSVTLDAGTSPSATLSAAGRRSSFDIGYAPRIGWVGLTDSRDLIVQHSAGMGYTWNARRLRLSLSISGSYGTQSYYSVAAITAGRPSAPAGGATGGDGATNGDGSATGGDSMAGMPVGTPGQMPGGQQTTLFHPQVSILQTASGSASLSAGYDISHRTALSFGIGYSLGGGLGDSEQYLPFRQGPNAGVSLGYQLSKTDGVASSLGGAIDFLPKRDARYYTITWLETWMHKFSPLMSGTLGAGVTFLQSRTGPDAPRTRTPSATGVAGLTRTFKLDGGAQLNLGGAGALSTYYNPVLGTMYQSLSGGVNVGWSRKELAFGAGLQGSHSLPFDSPSAIRSVGANLNATYQVSEAVSLNAGSFWTHQVLPPGTLTVYDPNRWGAALGVRLTAPPLKL